MGRMRTDSGPPNSCRGCLHHICVFVAGVFDLEVQRSILFWRYVIDDHCGGHDGFHGSGTELFNVATV